MQFVAKAACANLKAEPDDGHSNLGWNGSLNGFLSQPILSDGAIILVGASIDPLKIGVFRDDEIVSALALENTTEGTASAWLDAELQKLGLNPASDVSLPYELPKEAAEVETFSSGSEGVALSTLSAWFDFAHSLLSGFAAANANLVPGPSPVRCWPHHFDIATYVGLEAGDFETAKGIGVGMSPGDESYEQPYFYINPFPDLDIADLPAPPAPGHWHTEGFVGAVATADEILSLPQSRAVAARFIANAFSIGLTKLRV
nr:MAG: hypothetical protein E4H34_02060 [Hyphomicrobiales bacterium]